MVVGATGAGAGKAEARILRQCGLDAAGYEALAQRIEATLRGQPPMTVQELRGALGEDAPAHREALPFAVGLLGRQCRVLRARVRGGWQSDVYAYAGWGDWLGAPAEPLEPAVARAELARRYLRAFGPAMADDLRWWAGWAARDASAAIAALGDEVEHVAIDDAGEALILADDLDALRTADPGSAAGVRLLPLWDAYTMGYAARARLVAAADLPRVYDRSGNGTAVALVDGVAAGVWELDAPAGGRAHRPRRALRRGRRPGRGCRGRRAADRVGRRRAARPRRVGAAAGRALRRRPQRVQGADPPRGAGVRRSGGGHRCGCGRNGAPGRETARSPRR